jgi:hypothetical protein
MAPKIRAMAALGPTWMPLLGGSTGGGLGPGVGGVGTGL